MTRRTSAERWPRQWHGFRNVTGKPGTVSHDEDQLFPKAAATLRRKEKTCEREIEDPSTGPRATSERHTCVSRREEAPGASPDHRSRCLRRGRDAWLDRVPRLDRSGSAMGHHLRLRGHPDQIQPRKPDIPGSSVGTPKPCGRATGSNPALALFRSHLSAIEKAGEVATHLPQFYATVVDHHLTARRAPAPEGCGSGSRGSGPAGRDGTRKVALIPEQSLTAPGT